MISTDCISSSSGIRHPELIDDFATGSLLAYSDAHQMACCHALESIGFGNISLNKIEKYLSSAQNWSAHLRKLIDAYECRLFFPNNGISMQNISQLAQYHDRKRRTTTNMRHALNLRESRENFRRARQEHRDLHARLSIQSYWINTTQLPLTEDTLQKLYLVQHQGPGGRTQKCEKASQWLSTYLRSNTLLEAHLACGNIKKLTILVEQAVQFARSREYKRTLGTDFNGIYTNWAAIQANLLFLSEVQSLLKHSAIDHEVMSNWAEYEPHFFSLCRKASLVRRRLHKLNSLVKRQYATPAESTGYMAIAQRSISHLHIWLTVLKNTYKHDPKLSNSHCNLTPKQLLEKLTAKQIQGTNSQNPDAC